MSPPTDDPAGEAPAFDDPDAAHRPSLPAQSAGTSAAIGALLERRRRLPSFISAGGANSEALDALVPSIPPQPRPPGDLLATAPTGEREPSEPPPAAAGSAEPDPMGVAALLSLGRRVGSTPDDPLPRATLLAHLAQRCDGTQRSRLLSAAAELHAASGNATEAHDLHAQALAADATSILALRELRRDAVHSGDYARAAELINRELTLPMSPLESALTRTALAELQRTALGQVEDARNEAEQAVATHPRALSAGLLIADVAANAGQPVAAAEALRRAAEMWEDGGARGALLLQAGRLLLAAGDQNQAQSLIVRASRGDHAGLSAHLEAHRAAMAKGDLEAALEALSRAREATPPGPIRAALLRIQARLLLDRRRNPEAALEVLKAAEGPANQRLRARAAEAAGDAVAMEDALKCWAAETGGVERALASAELACLHLAAERPADALPWVEAALEAAPELGFVQLAADWLARESGDELAARTAAGTRDESDQLARAAKLWRASEKDECHVLTQGLPDDGLDPTGVELAIDAAARSAPELLDSLLRSRSARLPASGRLGLRLLMLELADPQDVGEQRTRLTDLMSDAGAHPAALSDLRTAAHSASARSTAYRRMAEESHGGQAAVAWTMSGRALERAGQPPGDAYGRALRASPGHLPAAWALDRGAGGDRSQRAQRKRDLAAFTRDPVERATYLVQAANCEGERAAEQRDLAAAGEAAGHDALLVERSMQGAAAGAGAGAIPYGALLDLASGASPSVAAAIRLRAAAGLEASHEWNAAADCYRMVPADSCEADREMARDGLLRCLRVGGHAEAICELLREELSGPGGDSAQVSQLRSLGAALESEGLSDEALQVWQRAEGVMPGDLTVLRALARLSAMRSDDSLAAHAAMGLATHLNNPVDRTSQIRLAATLFARSGDQVAMDAAIVGADTRADRDDLWLATALEGAARRRDDPELILTATMRIAQLLKRPLEQASMAMRAAEAIEPVSVSQASVALMGCARGAPAHPVASEELGRLCRAAGEYESAALAFEAAAKEAQDPRRATRLWHSAGCIRQDYLDNAQRARADFEEALALDLLHRDAFERTRHLMEAGDDPTALAELLQRRIAVQPAAPASTFLELVELREKLQQPNAAHAVLRAWVTAHPSDLDALRKLADALADEGDWPAAAERLVELARRTTNTERLRQTFFRLGDLYSRHMPDLKRAEIAFQRCLSIEPGDRHALERLAEVLADSKQSERAVRAAQHLVDLASTPEEIERYTVRLAGVFDSVGKAQHAERTLSDYLQMQPTSVASIDALAQLYTKEQDPSALAVLMHRSFHTFRREIARDPADIDTWRAFHRLGVHQSQGEVGRAIASAAQALGIGPKALLSGEDALGQPVATPPPGEVARGPEARLHMLDRLREDLLGPSVLRFFRQVAPVLEQVLPLEPRFAEHTPMPTPPSHLATACGVAQQAFELEGIRVEQIPGRGCLPIAASPLTIAIGVETVAEATPAELSAILLGLAALARNGLHAAVRSPENEFAQCFHALVKYIDPGHVVPEAMEPGIVRYQPGISRALTRSTRASIDGTLHAMAYEYSNLDPVTLRRAAMSYWPRAALILTGDCGATLGGLLRSLGAGGLEGGTALRTVTMQRHAAAQELFEFAVSQAHFEAIAEPSEDQGLAGDNGDGDAG